MWLKREKKDESVTLTLTVISFIALLVACGLEIAGVVKSTSVLLELFGANVAMYLGRRISIGNKVFDGSKEKENESK